MISSDAVGATKLSSAKRVFVTGVYGSGKTHFAQRLAAKNRVQYLSFDGMFDYADPANQSKAILGSLPQEFVIDAIPFDEKHSWDDFTEYEAMHPAAVVCVYCPDRHAWIQRIRDKKLERLLMGYSGIRRPLILHSVLARKTWLEVSSWPGNPLQKLWGFLKTWFPKAMRARDAVVEVDEKSHRSEFRRFFEGKLPGLRSFRSVVYFDSIANAFTSEQEMLDRIGYEYFPFESYLDAASEQYDSRYQDIEIIDFIGYSRSYKTWERIQDLVQWKGVRVVDLGCFHGYFCFKIEDAGGTAHGLDNSALALKTARKINELRGGEVRFSEWEGGADIPQSDVILCLNVLHHFPDQQAALAKMRASQVLFEVNRDQIPMIRSSFTVVRRVSSHRRGRTILLCEQPR